MTIRKSIKDLALNKNENHIKLASISRDNDQRGVFDGKIVSVGVGVTQGFGSKNILNKVPDIISPML